MIKKIGVFLEFIKGVPFINEPNTHFSVRPHFFIMKNMKIDVDDDILSDLDR